LIENNTQITRKSIRNDTLIRVPRFFYRKYTKFNTTGTARLSANISPANDFDKVSRTLEGYAITPQATELTRHNKTVL
jgi:hypothetical protein